jgi:O-methyltransferase
MKAIRRTALADAKDVLTRTGLRRFLLPKYRYMFSPEQLWAICQAAETGYKLGGAFAEIGVFDGGTTVYLHRHLEGDGEPPVYYCIDTFSGFTNEDIEVERQRGKTDDYADLFYYNSKACFERTMKMNGIDRAVVVQADAGTYDYSTLPPLSFALIDVDLLRPMRVALAGCWDRMVPGGIMVVDDCETSEDRHTTMSAFDGALVAYEEFCEKQGLERGHRA